MKNFSHKHKLHLLVTFEYKDLACFTSLHLMSYEMFSSFKLHMYLLSSVECLYRSLRNEHTFVSVSKFKSSVTKSDVCFLRGCSGDFSLVDDIFRVTGSIHRARVGFPAITVFLLIVGACGFVNFSFVLIRYYCFDVTPQL